MCLLRAEELPNVRRCCEDGDNNIPTCLVPSAPEIWSELPVGIDDDAEYLGAAGGVRGMREGNAERLLAF